MKHFNRSVLLCQWPVQWCHFKTVCIWEGDNNIFISFQIDNNWSQPNFYEFLNFYELKLLTLNTEIKVPVTSPAGLFGCDARIFHLWSFLYYCIRVHVSRPILSYQNSEQYHLYSASSGSVKEENTEIIWMIIGKVVATTTHTTQSLWWKILWKDLDFLQVTPKSA